MKNERLSNTFLMCPKFLFSVMVFKGFLIVQSVDCHLSKPGLIIHICFTIETGHKDKNNSAILWCLHIKAVFFFLIGKSKTNFSSYPGPFSPKRWRIQSHVPQLPGQMQLMEIEDAQNRKERYDKGLEVPHKTKLKAYWERCGPSTGQVHGNIQSE